MAFVITSEGLFEESAFSSAILNYGDSVYEVIRVVDGIALFLEDHYQRLLRSLEIKHVKFNVAFSFFQEKVYDLIRLNQRSEGNVRFMFSITAVTPEWYVGFIPHSYPSAIDYETGVTVGLLRAERENPNAKVIQKSVRDRANQMIAEQGLYEVLLVDREGKITEGSRSNVFFVKNGVFYTAPDSMILVGITRQKVMNCISELDFKVAKDAVSADQINQYDAVFLTGTSPKVLPICSIEGQLFDCNIPCLKYLMKAYDRLINCYIEQSRSCSG